MQSVRLWRCLVSSMPPLAIFSFFLLIFQSEWKSLLSHVTDANMGTFADVSIQFPATPCYSSIIPSQLWSRLHHCAGIMPASNISSHVLAPLHFILSLALFIFFIVRSPQPQSSDNSGNFHILISMAGRTRLRHRRISKCNILRRCNLFSRGHAVHAPSTLWRHATQGVL